MYHYGQCIAWNEWKDTCIAKVKTKIRKEKHCFPFTLTKGEQGNKTNADKFQDKGQSANLDKAWLQCFLQIFTNGCIL